MISGAKKFGVRLLVALLVVAMAAFGLDSFFYGSSQAALEVNGEEIYQGQIDASISNYQNSLVESYGQDVVNAFGQEQIANLAQQQLIQQVLLRQRSDELGLSVSDRQVEAYLATAPDFFVDGKFSKDALANYIASSGITLSQLMDNLRFGISQQLFVDSFAASQGFTVSELNLASGVLFNSRNVLFASVDHSSFTSSVDPAEEELASHFEENAATYSIPASATFDYVVINSKDFIDTSYQPGDAELDFAYQDRLAESETNTLYEVSHILINTSDRSKEDAKSLADDIARKIASGEEFAQLARQHSDDSGSAEQGGSLGSVDLDNLVPEFSDQVRLMEPGEISSPVLSNFGYHIIRLDSTPQSSAPAFEEVKEELITRLREERAQQVYGEQVEKLSNLVTNASDLSNAETGLGLTITTSKPVQRFGNLSDEVNSIFINPDVLGAAFNDKVIKQGLVSDLIELEDKAVVVKLNTYTPERQQELEEVIEKIKGEVIRKQSKQIAEKLVADIIALQQQFNEQGNSVEYLQGNEWKESIENAENISWNYVQDVQLKEAGTESEDEKVELPPNLKQQVFSSTEFNTLLKQSDGEAELIYVVTEESRPAFASLTEDQQKEVIESLLSSSHSSLSNTLVAFLLSEANIRRNQQ